MPIDIQPSTSVPVDTQVSTDSLLHFVSAAADDAPEDAEPVAAESDPAEDLEDELGASEADALLTIIDAFVTLFPSPQSQQLASLADALNLEGPAREDFILALVEELTGTDEDNASDLAELDTSDDDDDDDDDDSDEDDDEDEEEDGPDQQSAARALAAIASLSDVSNPDDELSDGLMNDGQDIDTQRNADDLAIQDDGEPDIHTKRTPNAPPEGAFDGKPVHVPSLDLE